MELVNAFKKGDWLTRSSAIVMGLGNILRKQFIKGILFLFTEGHPILFNIGFQTLIGALIHMAVPSGTAGPW